MVKVGIIGATGYAGNELVRLLMGHKDVEIMWYGSRSYIDKKYAEVYQNMFEIGISGRCPDRGDLIQSKNYRSECGLPYKRCQDL